ncbi:hypothetical protein E0J20_09180 [Rhizobium leguminosarum bv. viciae]|nr:hypothetical protein E0J20_09180 [Rhizobium leguminosarum bv. viciae]
MVTIEKLTGVEGIAYQYSLQEWSKQEKASTSNITIAAALKAGPKVADEIVSYMDGSKKFDQDNGAQQKESEGRKLILGEIAAPDLDAWKEKKKAKKGRKTPKPKQVESFGESGEKLDFEEAVLLGKGYHPKTGEDLVQRNKKDPDNRTFGNDVQFGAPKSVSTIWGLASSAANKGSALGLRYKLGIEAAQAAGVKRALQYAHENGLLIARRSDSKHGHEGAGMVIFGQYDHYTNRNGEPHVHTHNLWFNVCVRSDGTTGAVDNRQLKAHAAIIGALYRMEMGASLRENLGLRASKVDRNFEIDGVSEELVVALSTRRKDVVDYLAAMGIENTAEHREAAKHASRNTRKDKSEQLPLIELYEVWDNLAKEHGVTFESLVESVQQAADKKNASENEDWIAKQVEDNLNGKETADETRPDFDLNEIKARAYAAVVLTNSAFAERRILKAVFEELQVYTNVDTAVKVVEDLINSNDLIPLAMRKDDLYFTTSEIAQKEQGLVNDALSMLGNLEIMNPNVVRSFTGRQVVDDKGQPIFKEDGSPAYLKPEQIDAVKHCCGADQISVVHGAAGSGKSKMLGTVADIHRHMGQEVHAIAPSHKAKQVIAADANIELEMARAVAGLVSAYDKGKLNLSSKSTLIVDEAGMVGLDDMTRLKEIAKETGARLILSGDKYQLPSIARGAPLALLSRDDICGAAVLIDIVRQKDPRQREASILMAKGKTADGLKHYVDTRRVSLSDKALGDTMTAYMADREKNPAATRMIGVFRNAHATQLNLKTREGLIADGTLKGEGFTIEAWTRGLNQRVVEREFNAGEKIIFGETFRIGDMEISNNTTATILKIEMGGNEPVFTIRTEGPDPKTFTAKPSEMVGYRDEKAKDKTTPKIDYAYAQTVYSLQGSTFDRMFVYAGEAGNAELAYVMMTRHRLDCQVFVDRTRIYDELVAKAGKIVHLDKKTGAAPEENTTVDSEPTEEEIRAVWLKENSTSGRKLNVCDFHESVEEFLAKDFSKTGEKQALNADLRKEEAKAYAEENARAGQPASPVAAATIIPRPPMPRGIGRIGGPATAAKVEPKTAELEKPKTLADEALDRLNNGKAAQAVADAKAKRDQANDRSRVDRDEIYTFSKKNLYDFMLSRGGEKDPESTQGLGITHAKYGRGEEYTVRWGKGVKAVVTHWDRGDNWTFFIRGTKTFGNIVEFLKWQSGMSDGDAKHYLRDQFRTKPGQSPASSTPVYTPHVEKPFREQLIDAIPTKESFDPAKVKRTNFGWQSALKIENGLLSRELLRRGINQETQELLSSTGVLRMENPDWTDRVNKGTRENPVWEEIPNKNVRGWLVSMRNAWDTVVGYIRKGPDGVEAGKSFSANGPATQRVPVMFGDTVDPKFIAYAESIPDSMTVYQEQNYRPDTLYVTSGGQPKITDLAVIFDLAREHPEATLVRIRQNDAASDAILQKVTDAYLAGNPEAKVVDVRPKQEFKDKNEQHMAQDAGRIKAELEAFDAKQQKPAFQEKRRPPLPPRPQPLRWDRPIADPEAAEAYRKRQQKEAEERQAQQPKGPTM